jgi:hypothetical protein
MRELRRVFLNNNDLVQAIRAVKPERLSLPAGLIARIEVKPEHLVVKLEKKYVDSVQVLDAILTYDKLVEVLIQFCIERRIRLPRAGRKSASAAGEEVCLEITLGPEPASRTATRR